MCAECFEVRSMTVRDRGFDHVSKDLRKSLKRSLDFPRARICHAFIAQLSYLYNHFDVFFFSPFSVPTNRQSTCSRGQVKLDIFREKFPMDVGGFATRPGGSDISSRVTRVICPGQSLSISLQCKSRDATRGWQNCVMHVVFAWPFLQLQAMQNFMPRNLNVCLSGDPFTQIGTRSFIGPRF